MYNNLQHGEGERDPQSSQVIGVCVFLVLAVLVVFGQTAGFGFVNYDDNKYIYENTVVRKGLTWPGVVWASTYSEIGHWHPLTWLTHMADCQVYGLRAGGHHMTNVALHATAAVLLFLVLRTMTGAVWRSGIVAAVFAVHPLRAESVAWISERKDVLSGVFFMLTLWAYVRYVRQPTRWRYGAMAALFALGLLAKNMLVTLPFVLLLLDWWPLGRMRRSENGREGLECSGLPFWKLVKEKIPLLLLSVGSCVATASVSEKMREVDRIPAPTRIGNAVVSYVVYLRQMVFPAGLATSYPYPNNGLPMWKVCAALVALVAVTAMVVACRQKRPFLLVGWLWYLGMLLPAIGIIQISYYARADRYTYLPEIGLAVAATWAVADLSARWKHRQIALGTLMGAVISLLMVCGYIQTSYWKDSEVLWRHTLSCNPDNLTAHLDLADLFRLNGRMDEAAAEYREALAVRPDSAETLNDLGNILAMKGQDTPAMELYQKAITVHPDFVDTYANVGNLLMHSNVDEAIAQYRKGLAIAPDTVNILNDLGKALAAKGDNAAAIAQYQKVLAIEPTYANAHFNLGNRLLKVGRFEEAAAQFRKALELQPNDAEARIKLGKALLLKGDFVGGVASFEHTMPLNPELLPNLFILGNYFLVHNDWETAIACYRQALKMNPRSADACASLGTAFFKKGDYKQTIEFWQQALALNPAKSDLQNNLAHLLATAPDASLRDGPKAIALATEANRLSGGGKPEILQTLAAAYAQAGSYKEAAETARRALELALTQNQGALAAILKREITLYETNAPPPTQPR
jgi:tetratricopeptide (TPR) repeat protein